MSDLILRPSLECSWPEVLHPLIHCLAVDLSHLEQAGQGDLLGFALCHGIGRHYISGAVTEYGCAFVGTGDGSICDGTVIRSTPEANEALLTALDCAPEIPGVPGICAFAPLFHWALGNSGNDFETIHFADFTAAMVFHGPERRPEIRIFADPVRDARHAERRAAEIGALFTFLGEWHDTLKHYSLELPTPEMFRQAA